MNEECVWKESKGVQGGLGARNDKTKEEFVVSTLQ